MVFPTHAHPRPSAVTASPLGQLSHVSVCARKYSPLTEHASGACETPNELQSPSTWWGSGCQRRKQRLSFRKAREIERERGRNAHPAASGRSPGPSRPARRRRLCRVRPRGPRGARSRASCHSRAASTRAREVFVLRCCHRKRKRPHRIAQRCSGWYRPGRYHLRVASFWRLNDCRAPIEAHPLSSPRRCARRTHGLRHDELRGERGQAPGWLGDAPEGGPDRRPGACRDATPPAHSSGPEMP